ncbi:MAG: hypothetical protein EAZ38_02855 [Cytophagales bacterium]|nr:MAG: hypothetical protein EAZ38_02855 [Cytophagales bacterium]
MSPFVSLYVCLLGHFKPYSQPQHNSKLVVQKRFSSVKNYAEDLSETVRESLIFLKENEVFIGTWVAI